MGTPYGYLVIILALLFHGFCLEMNFLQSIYIYLMGIMFVIRNRVRVNYKRCGKRENRIKARRDEHRESFSGHQLYVHVTGILGTLYLFKFLYLGNYHLMSA